MTAVQSRMLQAAAAAIANARGGRRGAPPIANILEVLPPNLLAEVTEDAGAALAAADKVLEAASAEQAKPEPPVTEKGDAGPPQEVC